jgi:transposase
MYPVVNQKPMFVLGEGHWDELKKLRPRRDSLNGTKRRGLSCEDLRLRIEGILWVLRTGAGGRDLPVFFSPWQSVYSCFRAWTRNGL